MQPTREIIRGKPIRVMVAGGRLNGELAMPRLARGVVLFTHGGGPRQHPRYATLTRALGQAQIASVTLDLLTEEETHIDRVTEHLRLDIDLLAERLLAAAEFLSHHRQTAPLRLGVLATGPGAGAALIAAAQRPDSVHAVVSYAGRPDLALSALDRAQVPTLFIVGSKDNQGLELNRSALDRLRGPKRLEVLAGAGKSVDDPAMLERVAQLATQWFTRHLGRTSPLARPQPPE